MAKAKTTTKKNAGPSFAERMRQAKADKKKAAATGVGSVGAAVASNIVTAMAHPEIGAVTKTLPPITDESINRFLSVANKKFGKGAVVRLGDPGAYEEVKVVIPTGFPSLDRVFGVGGLPMAKFTQISGKPSSGKTTLSKYLAMRAQMVGILPSLKDTEKSGVLEYDVGLGVDPGHALAAQPSTMEDVFNQILSEVETAATGKDRLLEIWDSIAATPLKEELEGGVEDSSPIGLRARFLSRHLKKLIDILDERVGLLFVNQIRQKIGAAPYQQQDFAPGGYALDHYCHVHLKTTHIGYIKPEGSGPGVDPIGMKFRVKAIKNKIAPPNREAELHLYFSPPRLVDPTVPLDGDKPRRVAVRE